MLKKLVNKYVPMGLLPRRYNFEQQLRLAFEKSSGRTIEQAFALCEVDRGQIRPCIDRLNERYSKEAFSSGEEQLVRTVMSAVADLTDYIIRNCRDA